MKYGLKRTINPQKWFPELKFESIVFMVEDCDSKEQAMKEIEDWIFTWKNEMKNKVSVLKIETDKVQEAVKSVEEANEQPF